MLEQFINEIKIQMFLNHPNIVKVFGFFDDLSNFYIVMEYMEGGNLFNLIKKQKKLSEAETIERLKSICLGLKEMHDNSILHRDIKPENIVITNVLTILFRMFASCVTSDGQPYAKIAEPHTAARLTTCLPKSLVDRATTTVLTSGVWGFLLTR
jgi:serine/threonine protein kinase